jgi:predicted amidophosphoribosyltransferase
MTVLMSDGLGSCPYCGSRLALTSKFCPLCQKTLLPGQIKPPPSQPGGESARDKPPEKRVNELFEDFFQGEKGGKG